MEKAIYPVIPNDKLPLRLEGTGFCGVDTKVHRESGAASHLFIITESGTGELVSGGEKLIMKSGSIAYIPPQSPFAYHAADGEWSARWIMFGGACAADISAGFGLTETAVFTGTPDGNALRAAKEIYDAASDPINGAAKASRLVYGLLAETAAGIPELIAPAVKLIDKSYMQELTLERMAALCGVSLQHFCRVFRAAMGMRPMEYLAHRRMCAAKALLDDSGMKIYDIAAAVGYDDQNYFGITFKKYEGVTPTEYRRVRGND